MTDGTTYRLRMPAYDAAGDRDEALTTTNVGTPLAAWVDNALARLAPYWSSTQPE